MLLSCVSQSDAGPVRKNNEDYLAFWQPGNDAERLKRGSIMVMADGVGGQGHGEVASRMAVETALELFRDADTDVSPKRLLKEIFEKANLKIYDIGMNDRNGG